MVTLAPERRHGLEAIGLLVRSGVVAAVGHTDATYAQTGAALDAGARVGTHLFNAMRPLHHREPGPVLALLDDDRAHLEVIADGVHLHPAIVRRVMLRHPERVVLVTDAMAAAAAADGDYELGPIRVRVTDGVARVVDTGAIAGSTLTMAAALRYAVSTAGIPLEQAVRAATVNPATMLGLDRAGRLLPGHRADLIVLDQDLQVRRTMLAGAWVES
jgi:N-acetylglucosamine-6-phosphate deacetylase